MTHAHLASSPKPSAATAAVHSQNVITIDIPFKEGASVTPPRPHAHVVATTVRVDSQPCRPTTTRGPLTVTPQSIAVWRKYVDEHSNKGREKACNPDEVASVF